VRLYHLRIGVVSSLSSSMLYSAKVQFSKYVSNFFLLLLQFCLWVVVQYGLLKFDGFSHLISSCLASCNIWMSRFGNWNHALHISNL
jgi:hypothetical protein